MKKRIFIVLLAAQVAIAALLCSCGGCSSKTASTPAEVQGKAEVQATPGAAVEKAAVSVAEEAAEAAPVETETAAEEETSSATVAPAPAVVAEEEASEAEPAEEPVAAKAAAQEAETVAEPEPAAVASEPAAPATAAAVAEEPVAETAESEGAEGAEKACGGHIITVGLSPWGWQHFHLNIDELDDKNSTYGLGGKLAYTYLFKGGFYVGAEASYQTYFMEHRDNYHDVMFLADAGYNLALTDKLGLYAGLGGGVTLECYNGNCSPVGTAKASLGLGWSLSEHWVLGAGCDGIFTFPIKDKVKFVNTQIVPCIAASYKF